MRKHCEKCRWKTCHVVVFERPSVRIVECASCGKVTVAVSTFSRSRIRDAKK